MMRFSYFILIYFCSATIAQEILRRGMGKSDERVSLNEHNKYRRRVASGKVPNQPKASNLGLLKWDKQLAQKAQEVADTCVFEHVTVTDDRWIAVGQNLYTSMSTARNDSAHWREAVKAWFNEYKIYTFGSPFSPATGHYTQLIWANTKYLGCGYTICKMNTNFPFQKFYVCHYGPAGNFVGEVPYKTGN